MSTAWLIDADTHITEPPDLWTSRVPARYRERVPQMVRDDSGRDIWVLDGNRIAGVALTATAGWPEPVPAGPPTFADCPPAAHDPTARLAYMDSIGVWTQVLYPNVGGFGSQKFLALGDPELQLACVRAYNDFLTEFAATDPRRFVPVTAVPFWDVEAAVTEVRRCAEQGHRGVLFTGEPDRFGQPHLGDRAWDPLWRTASDAGLAIHLHIGSGDFKTGFGTPRQEAHGTAATYAYVSCDLFLKNGLQVADLITCGLLPRFPDLRFVSVESGIGWIPFVLEAADHSYLEARAHRTSEWELLPSDYFRRQVYSTFWFEHTATSRLLGEIPVDRVLFETDYPHPTCLYGSDVRARVEAGLEDVAPADRHRILWQNAADLYGVAVPDTEPRLLTPAAP